MLSIVIDEMKMPDRNRNAISDRSRLENGAVGEFMDGVVMFGGLRLVTQSNREGDFRIHRSDPGAQNKSPEVIHSEALMIRTSSQNAIGLPSQLERDSESVVTDRDRATIVAA